MSLRIGITLGDVTGIGPEVALQALALDAAESRARYLLIGDVVTATRWNDRLNLGLPLEPTQDLGIPGRFAVWDPVPSPLPADLPAGAPVAARAAIAWLRAGAERCLRGELAALVTSPVSKEAVIRSGQAFVGQTEFLAELAGTPDPVMMLLGTDDRGRWLRVVLVTTHLPLRRVPDAITPEAVAIAIRRGAEACETLGLPRARVAVCGLNPHAGEGGALGTEEIRVIAPAVAYARGSGLDAVGPLAADTVFHQALRGDYDVVVAMYHDQGLAPLKLAAFDSGVNWSLGLPFIRTSPDHGTAYDIAGRGTANPSSQLAAIRLARQLAGIPG